MEQFLPRFAAAASLMTALVALSGSAADARSERVGAKKPRVVFVHESGLGCRDAFERLLCNGFLLAVRRTGADGQVITPSRRENPVDALGLVARQRYDLVIVFGFDYYVALGEVARREPEARFAIMDAPLAYIPGRPRNVEGVVFRTSEAAYLAGWLAGRLERRSPGRDAVGVVAGVRLPSVDDYVIGFRAGVQRASPGTQVFVEYSGDFLDATKCAAIARRQIARGAGVVFHVASGCGRGALEAAKEAGVWGIGVDTDQSFLGPHILTSVVKRYGAGFLRLLRQARAGRIPTGRDTVLTLQDAAVGLGKINRRVPASLRSELERLKLRVARGEIRVPGAFADPR
jgi:basic membrane protein A and related proteins